MTDENFDKLVEFSEQVMNGKNTKPQPLPEGPYFTLNAETIEPITNLQAVLPTLSKLYIRFRYENGVSLRREKANKWYAYRRLPKPGAVKNKHNGFIETKLVKRYIGKDENVTVGYVLGRFEE